MDEVQQRKQVNPHQVDQMPVQGGELDGAKIGVTEIAPPGAADHPDNDAPCRL